MKNKSGKSAVVAGVRAMFSTRRDSEISLGLIVGFALIIGIFLFSNNDEFLITVIGGAFGGYVGYVRQKYLTGLKGRISAKEKWYWTVCIDGKPVASIADSEFAKIRFEVYQSRKNYVKSLAITMAKGLNIVVYGMPAVVVALLLGGCLTDADGVIKAVKALGNASPKELNYYATWALTHIVPSMWLISTALLVIGGQYHNEFSIKTNEIIKRRFRIRSSLEVTLERVVDRQLVQNDEQEYLRQTIDPASKPKSLQAGYLPTGEKTYAEGQA